ncbi:MAG TPA: metallophosphoesterase family protein [Nitrososphaeraceae archaeon]|nr:metallophosphoesterase family protein [Nitrososphaeraceae archaeon]
MQLVQLSDIHVGSFFKQQIFDTVVDEVNKLNPDAIIITGDLTDEGLLFQFEYAHAQIKKFTCSNIIVLAGNHDYRHTGYLVFKKFFPSKQQIYEFDDAVILTLGTARPDRDEGEVGYRQNLWMENTLGKYGNDNDDNNKKIKIIAMHHHLIGIPDTGTDKIIIVDAGDTLRACLQSGVDLVICGHKHRPWMWNLGALQIVYAGTTSSERYRGFFENAYNIVNIKDGKASVDIKTVGGKRTSLVDIVEKYRPYLEM